jgi:Rad3-related DNA helicase
LKRKVFIEPDNDQEAKLIKEQYEEESKTGAMFFLTARGRLIEGIDFFDYQSRAIFMIGVPNADRNSCKISMKMEYLDNLAS